jgi:hypothetical protein
MEFALGFAAGVIVILAGVFVLTVCVIEWIKQEM